MVFVETRSTKRFLWSPSLIKCDDDVVATTALVALVSLVAVVVVVESCNVGCPFRKQ